MKTTSKVCAWVLGVAAATVIANYGSSSARAAESAERTSSAATMSDVLAPAPLPAACCKVCSKGKACGDSCIARSKECHQPPGCACDG